MRIYLVPKWRKFHSRIFGELWDSTLALNPDDSFVFQTRDKERAIARCIAGQWEVFIESDIPDLTTRIEVHNV